MLVNYRYEIDENNEIRIWDLDNPNELDAPFLYQPTWPDMTPWGSREEAESWALAFIDSRNEESNFAAGFSPDEPVIYFDNQA